MSAELTLAVVIAAWPNLDGLAGCLEALAPQRDHCTEVLVVSPVSPPEPLRERYLWVRWVEADPGRLIPHLWGLGMAETSGEVVAISTAHFAPVPDWAAAVRQAHARLEAPAIGGRIEPPRRGRAVDWATYFLRYSPYLGYDREKEVPDLAGDNASY